MKALVLASILGTVAPAASAGDWDIDFSVFFGRESRHDHRHDRRDDHGRDRRDDRRYDRRRDHRDVRVEVIRHECERIYVPGRYDTVRKQVCIPGYYTTRFVPALYEWRTDHCGRRIRVEIRPACHECVWVPERHEWRHERVFVPGYWTYRCSDPCHRH